MATIESPKGHALAILNYNKPVCYCSIPPNIYEAMYIIDDIELAKIAQVRLDSEIRVKINSMTYELLFLSVCEELVIASESFRTSVAIL